MLSVSVDENTGSPLCFFRRFVLAASMAHAALSRAQAAWVDANAAFMAEEERRPAAVRAAGEAAWAAAWAAAEAAARGGAVGLTEVGTPLPPLFPPALFF